MKIEDFEFNRMVDFDNCLIWSTKLGDFMYIISLPLDSVAFSASIIRWLTDCGLRRVFDGNYPTIDECLASFDKYNKENNIECI